MTPDITIDWNGESIILAPQNAVAVSWMLMHKMAGKWQPDGSLAMTWREADELLDRAERDGIKLV